MLLKDLPLVQTKFVADAVWRWKSEPVALLHTVVAPFVMLAEPSSSMKRDSTIAIPVATIFVRVAQNLIRTTAALPSTADMEVVRAGMLMDMDLMADHSLEQELVLLAHLPIAAQVVHSLVPVTGAVSAEVGVVVDLGIHPMGPAFFLVYLLTLKHGLTTSRLKAIHLLKQLINLLV